MKPIFCVIIGAVVAGLAITMFLLSPTLQPETIQAITNRP